jgi:hypothetical protein
MLCLPFGYGTPFETISAYRRTGRKFVPCKTLLPTETLRQQVQGKRHKGSDGEQGGNLSQCSNQVGLGKH